MFSVCHWMTAYHAAETVDLTELTKDVLSVVALLSL